ncbi:DUF2309 domain-containing protein [Bizionia sediminis]|uniref:Probable inorganic carbon transporter subunit DabA n=1 Tax=Bizionia sediminis TaxID=1737064 RepID=A0ABW5KRY3_9FLAO
MKDLLKSIDSASQTFGLTWPLYSFVTSNPLSGYEHLPFEEATQKAARLLQASTYPKASVYEEALRKGDIDKAVLKDCLLAHQLQESPETYLNEMKAGEAAEVHPSYQALDVIMAKWLAAFMDEGLAEWEMPNKERGFYAAWKILAAFDASLGKKLTNSLPDTSLEALEWVLQKNNITNYQTFFEQHMAPLSGWVGYIKHREQNNTVWQQSFPMSVTDYLAVRLNIAQHLYGKLEDVAISNTTVTGYQLKNIWLQAWEKSFQNTLVATLETQQEKQADHTNSEIAAQMVFCIDTRSEAIRRHVEAQGPYETYGYAGFFGIAMDYQHYDKDITTKSCPPIVASPYVVTEKPLESKVEAAGDFLQEKNEEKATEYVLRRLKNMLPSSFGFVEGAGFFYGISLTMQTIMPQFLYKWKTKNTLTHEPVCSPEISYQTGNQLAGKDIALEEKVAIVKSAFNLTGWQKFAPLVLFIGHGSHTTNNPFASSLDCGACAASPGRHNARVLAKLANLPEVRQVLRTEHEIDIPDNTVFLGGEHNTTTDAITLFDAQVPKSHEAALEALKTQLKKAQKTATQERLLTNAESVALAHKKATDWDETRPEWGLARNAGFIIAPRSLTQHTNLNGRCFLHSYNYKKDPTGAALEGILCGPMVVTQWINNHYYFTTVDTDKFGGGSKITHNITGKFAVVQGNGGDIKMGLPLQSLKAADNEMYHQPLRLTVVIQAPLSRVEQILKKHQNLQNLLDNAWIYLKVLDTDNNNKTTAYTKNFKWIPEPSQPIGNEVSVKETRGVLVN